MPLAFFLGPTEIALIIGMVVALFLMPKFLPRSMRGLGQGLMEFKRGLREIGKGRDDA